MPIVILVIGIILVAAGINNKVPSLMALLKEDFRPSDGSPSLQWWIVSIAGIGMLGYIKPLKGFATGFMFLVLLVLVLAAQKRDGSGGFFDKFTTALKG